jgi:CPA2 family monovalent cation:H+ antiporter-2
VCRTLVRLRRENGIEPAVIEMNLDTVRHLRAQGTHAVYGDAAHRETLHEAGVHRAASLFLTASGLTAPGEVIRVARELNPDIRVLARSAYLRERPDLFKCGADAVFAGEGEIALAMNEAVLRELGATPDQIDRERDRVREELFGVTPQSPPMLVPQPPDQEKPRTADAPSAAVAQPPDSQQTPIPPV